LTEIAERENDEPNCKMWKRRTWKYRTCDRATKACKSDQNIREL